MLRNRLSIRSWFAILCVMALFAILSSTMSKNPVLKPFATSLGAPNDLVGLVASASTIPGILVSFPAASLSDVLGRRKVLLFSALVFATAPFLYLFVTSWWQLVPIRFYHGFATAIFVPVTEAAIAEKYPTERGERISILSSFTAMGRAIAPFVGGYILLLTNYGYSSLYLAVGVAGLTALIIALLFLVETDTSDTNKDSSKFTDVMFNGWREVANRKEVQIVGFIQASQYYVFGAVEFFLVGYLTENVRLDPLSVGVIMGSQVIAIILARPLMGRLSDRIGRRTPIIFGSIMSVIVLASFAFFSYLPILLFLSVAYGIGFSAVISSTSPLVCDIVPPNLLGTSMGLLGTMMDIGQTLGPIVSGIILSATLQYSTLFYSLSALLLFSAIFFILSKTAKKKL
jgi:DHA1 family multidrug resistance protein-like MFS transporter